MLTTHAKITTLTGLAVLWLGAIAGAQSGEKFKIWLVTVPIDFVQAPKVTGSGSGTAVLAGDTLSIQGTFDGLQGSATVARVHLGRVKGVRGPAIADLTVSRASGGSLTGTVKLRREQIDALMAGRLYIQISSEAAPDGNLWGWLLR